MNLPMFFVLNMIIAFSYLITMIVLDKNSDNPERMENRSKYFWYYHGIAAFNTGALLMMDFVFLWFAFWDAYRRIYLMKQASKALETFHEKDPVTLKMPIINFLDRKSILTWLEVRKMVLETGARF